MTVMEYGGTAVRVPDGWGDVTLGDYEDAMALPRATLRDKIAVAARLCGVDAAVLLSWPAEAFGLLAERLSFAWSDFAAEASPRMRAGGVDYYVSTEDSLTLGEWADVEQVQQAGTRPIARVLAIVCRPAGEAYDSSRNEARAALFAGLPVSEVQGVLAFFLLKFQRSAENSRLYSGLRAAAESSLRSSASSRHGGDGTGSSTSWRGTACRILTAWPRYRLRRYLRTSSTSGSGRRRKRRSGHSRNH